MKFDYSKRGCLLPPGCKDLIDAINYLRPSSANKIGQPGIAKYQDSLMATLKLPEGIVGNIEIFVEGQQIRIATKSLPNIPFAQRLIEVPAGYNPAAAKATYFDGALRIFIPKF